MAEPIPQAVYRIELCGGEIRRWKYLGTDSQSQAWWRDEETGSEFSESSVMYAWEIVGEDAPPTDEEIEARDRH
jgi:hypothetical protein